MRPTSHVLLVALAAALLLGGCAAGEFTAVNGARLSTTPLSIEHTSSNPYYTGIIKGAGPTGLLVCSNGNIEYIVACYDTSMRQVWRRDVDVEQLAIARGFDAFDIKNVRTFRGRKHLVVAWTLEGRNDTLYVLASQFDLATGAVLDTVCLARTLRPREYEGNYSVRLSHDSLHLVVSIRDDPRTPDSVAFHALVFDSDLHKTHDVVLQTLTAKEKLRNPLIDVESNGKLLALWSDEKRVTHVNEYDPVSASAVRTLEIPLNAPADAEVEDLLLTQGMTEFQGDSMLVILNMAFDDDEIYGLAWRRMNLSTWKTELATYFPIPVELAKRLIDEKSLRDVRTIGGFITTNPMASYLVTFEQFEAKSVSSRRGYTTMVYNSGNLAVFAFDAQGKPTWQQSVEKSMRQSGGEPSIVMSDCSLSSDGQRLRFLYREDDQMKIRELRLSDGTDIPDRHHVYLLMSGNAGPMFTTMEWFNDSAAMFLGVQRSGVVGRLVFP